MTLAPKAPEASDAPTAAQYAIRGVTPAAVVRPGRPEEVAALLKSADDEGQKVVPWGAGTKQRWANAPTGYDVAVDLTALDQLVEYEPADLVVTVEAGMTLAALQERLRAAGQFLPLDPPYAGRATVGGTLATNASGPSRLLYGIARDFVLGLRVATPQGELVRSGGRVVKNVVGYDLNKLHVGGFGTAGVIVEATFKVQPVPAAETMVTASFASAAAAHAGAARLTRSALYLRAVEVVHSQVDLFSGASAASWNVVAWCSGSPAAVERQATDSTAALVAAGASYTVRLDPAPWLSDLGRTETGATLKLTCLPSQLGTLLGRAPESASITARAGSGVAYVHLAEPSAAEIRRLAAVAHELGGSAVLEDAPDAVKQALDSWDPAGHAAASRTDFDLMRAVKAQFDPKSTLNPGRFVAGI